MDEKSARSDDDQVSRRVGMFDLHPTAKLAAIAGAAGFIAVVTILLEIMTGRLPAKMLGFTTGFVSLPIGASAPILAALTSRHNVRYAAPTIVLSVVYWSLFVVYI